MDSITLKDGKTIQLEDIKHVGVSLIDNDCRRKGDTLPIISDLRTSRFKYITKDLEVRSGEKKTIKVLTKSDRPDRVINHYKELEFQKLKDLQKRGDKI